MKKNSRYKMSWIKKDGRWKKTYRNKTFFSPRTKLGKEASYKAAYAAFKTFRDERDRELDDEEANASRPYWIDGIQMLEHYMAEIIERYGDNSWTRRAWGDLDVKLQQFRKSLDRGDVHPDLAKGRGAGWSISNLVERIKASHELGVLQAIDKHHADMSNPPDVQPSGVAPWDKEPVDFDRVETLGDLVDAFLAARRKEAESGTISNHRYGKLDLSLSVGTDESRTPSLLRHVPPETPLPKITSPVLLNYLEHLRQLVASGSISAYTGRDQAQVVKQLFTWAYQVEHIDAKPRVLEKGYFIKVELKAVETVDKADLANLLIHANDRARLYIMLALNCGMTQQDISDLRHSEVDLKAGTITRRRSKTRGRENVPTVKYPLWPETIELLRQEASEHPTLFLTNVKGAPLIAGSIQPNGKLIRTCNVSSAWIRLGNKLVKDDVLRENFAFKYLRKTSASAIESHDTHYRHKTLFLGHAGATQGDRHYSKAAQESFARAIDWLHDEVLPAS